MIATISPTWMYFLMKSAKIMENAYNHAIKSYFIINLHIFISLYNIKKRQKSHLVVIQISIFIIAIQVISYFPCRKIYLFHHCINQLLFFQTCHLFDLIFTFHCAWLILKTFVIDTRKWWMRFRIACAFTRFMRKKTLVQIGCPPSVVSMIPAFQNIDIKAFLIR